MIQSVGVQIPSEQCSTLINEVLDAALKDESEQVVEKTFSILNKIVGGLAEKLPQMQQQQQQWLVNTSTF